MTHGSQKDAPLPMSYATAINDGGRGRPNWPEYHADQEQRRDLIAAAIDAAPLAWFVTRLAEQVPAMFGEIELYRHEPEEWSRPVRTIVRWLRSHARLTPLSQAAAWRLLQVEAPREFKSLREVGSNDGLSFLEEWRYFWPRVRYLPGLDTIAFAHRMTEATVGTLLPDSPRPRSKAYARFLTLCFWEALLNDGDVILLPVYRLAEILGVHTMTVSNMRKMATADGFIRRTAERVFPIPLADEFEFDFVRWRRLTSAAAGAVRPQSPRARPAAVTVQGPQP